MRRSTILIVSIWALLLLDAFRQGRNLPTSPLVGQFDFNGFGQVMLIGPFLFFVLAAFFQRHNLFSWPMVTRAIDSRFGDGTFARFLTQLKPVTLFMLACLVLGGTGLLSTHLSTKHPGAYVLSGFFFSGGLGLMAAYLLSIKFPPRLV